MKRFLSLLLVAVLVLSLAACGKTETPATDNTATNDTTATTDTTDTADTTTDAKTYKIGICQLVQHVALDAASQGFMDAITEVVGAENVTFDYQDASGDSANCALIVGGFVSDNVDLIMANATSPLQAASQATNTIPVLGTSVTDYATALGITDWNGTVGGNVSGCSDLAPLDQQAASINEIFPEAKTIGLLYCSAEANSVYQCTVIEGYLKDYGYEVKWYSFTDTNDVASVTQDACDNVDVIYIPTDNTAASNTEAIANVVLAAGVPVFAGEEGICAGCGVATLSISYYDLGYATGKMAVRILVDGEDISTMPVETAANVTKKYNEANCAALGITVPADYVPIG